MPTGGLNLDLGPHLNLGLEVTQCFDDKLRSVQKIIGEREIKV